MQIMQAVKTQEEAHQGVLSSYAINWLDGPLKNSRALPSLQPRRNTLPCLGVALRYSRCDHNSLTMALTSARFPCIVIIVVPFLYVVITSSTPGPSTLTFAITSFEIKLREAWFNSTSCRPITSSRTYSPKHYHDNDTMTDVTAPTGQAPKMAPPVHSNDQILSRIRWVQTGYLKFSAKGTKREVFGMPIPGSLITADLREASYYQEYWQMWSSIDSSWAVNPPGRPTQHHKKFGSTSFKSEYISDNESLHGAKNKSVGSQHGKDDLVDDSDVEEGLNDIDKNLDSRNVSDEILLKIMELTRKLHDINQMEARDYVQKSKIKWAIEWDENLKFFHGIINKKRSQLSIRGVFVDGDWNTDPEILANRLATVILDLVSDIQLAFVANRQILDGPFILNELLAWCKRKKKRVMIFKFDFAKAYDSIRWDYLLDVLQAFGFCPNWCKWIRGTFSSAMASILAASMIGCAAMQNPFRYLGVMVGDSMSRKLGWADTVQKLRSRLSKWKVKTLYWSVSGMVIILSSGMILGFLISHFVSGSITLSASKDRWICDLNKDGVFRVKEVRTILDDIFLPSAADAMRWVEYISIKINVFAWRAQLDRLSTRRIDDTMFRL
nr:RNA-directed DNA polymerase, eukaryota, reverse transcriptase zinc-binding domain protein [Tanacetum cinerariifolium]